MFGNAKKKQTNFQLVYKVLTELYAQVQTTHGKGADKLINECMESLQIAYKKLEDTKSPIIDYLSPVTRFVYVLKYVASHADYVRQVIGQVHDELGKHILAQRKLVVSCLGGGPGSELVGLLRYILASTKGKNEYLTVYLLDREQAWADAWTEIGQELDSDVKLFVNFQPLDVCDSGTWEKQRKFLSADVFISCYFASEIYRFKDKVGIWKELGKSAKKGAKVLFVDNDHSAFESYIGSVMPKTAWKLLALEHVKLVPGSEEEKSDLKEFLMKFKHQPKLKADLLFAVYEKQ